MSVDDDTTTSTSRLRSEHFVALSSERTPEVLSFRAVIVMTKHAGGGPTLRDVEDALRRAGLRFVMPADVAGSIVISVSDEA